MNTFTFSFVSYKLHCNGCLFILINASMYASGAHRRGLPTCPRLWRILKRPIHTTLFEANARGLLPSVYQFYLFYLVPVAIISSFVQNVNTIWKTLCTICKTSVSINPHSVKKPTKLGGKIQEKEAHLGAAVLSCKERRFLFGIACLFLFRPNLGGI